MKIAAKPPAYQAYRGDCGHRMYQYLLKPFEHVVELLRPITLKIPAKKPNKRDNFGVVWAQEEPIATPPASARLPYLQ